MNTLESYIESARERFGLLISAMNSMASKQSSSQADIDNIIDNVLGNRANGKKGILYFYQTMLRAVQVAYPGSTFLKGNSTSAQIKNYLLGSLVTSTSYSGEQYKGGKGSSLFGEDEDPNSAKDENETNFDIDFTDPLFLTCDYERGSEDSSEYFSTESQSILSKLSSPSGLFYSYTSDDRDRITDLTNLAVQVVTDIDDLPDELSTLTADVVEYLNGVFSTNGTRETWGLPMNEDILSIRGDLIDLQSLNTSWISTIQSDYQAIFEYPLYSSQTSPDSGLISAVRKWSQDLAQFSVFQGNVSLLGNSAESCLQLVTTNSVTDAVGLRRHWIYWILYLLDRPMSSRMDYNGAVEAQYSLAEQKESALTSVSMLADDNEYLPTPVLNCIYHDPDLDESIPEYLIVFTTIPCYNLVKLTIGDWVTTVDSSSVSSSSEIRITLPSTVTSTDEITIQLIGENEYVSPVSNVLSLQNPIYEAIS